MESGLVAWFGAFFSAENSFGFADGLKQPSVHSFLQP
jgi:hypothetical protein